MANSVELNGIHTWYDEQGTGEPLVLLHPGGVGVDSRAFGPNLSCGETGPLQQDTGRLLDKRPHCHLCTHPPRVGDARRCHSC